MPPVRGIPLDCLDPTLDIASESSRQASIFNRSLGIPDSGARDRVSNPFGGPAIDLRTGNLVMRIGEGTPYWYPRHLCCIYSILGRISFHYLVIELGSSSSLAML